MKERVTFADIEKTLDELNQAAEQLLRTTLELKEIVSNWLREQR